MITDFTLDFQRLYDGVWMSYDSGNVQSTGQLLTDAADDKRYIWLNEEVVFGKTFKITFNPGTTGSMSVRVDLLIQKLAFL